MSIRALRTSLWLVAAFASLHALTCLACRTMGVSDTWALTLLTLAMVFILCNQSGFRIYFTLVALVLFNVVAYLVGNALPVFLAPLLGESMWVNVISTTVTTLLLGYCLVAIMWFIARKPDVYASLITLKPGSSPSYERRSRWIVRLGNRIVPVQTEQIACFYSQDKCNYLMTLAGDRYIVDSTMDAIFSELDPDAFFRINRSCILSLGCIDSAVVSYGRYTVEVHPQLPEGVSTTVARSREDEFLSWMEKC